jgi:hypothetical protein
MSFNGVFVDDQDEVFAGTLSTPGELDLEFLAIDEVTNLVASITARAPLIAALDYRLDEVPGTLRQDQTFKGSALAQHLRDAAIEAPTADFAIVLVSAEAKIKQLFRPDVTAHDLFDRVYVKEQINQERAKVRQELLSLCRGYEMLRAASLPYDPATLLAGADIEADILSNQELATKFKTARAPHIVARTVLTWLIDRPGLLIDDAELCARLGISLDSLEAVRATAQQKGIAYTGVFSCGWLRWWAGRLDIWSKELFGRRATGIPASERAEALSAALGQAIAPAASTWDGSVHELIATACASCRRGTELRHSVAVFEPASPRFVERRRVCWDCVRTDRYETAQPPLIIDETERDIVDAIKSNAVSSQPEGD